MRKLLIAAAVAVLLAAGWWYASPYWTLHRMQSAAQRGDTQALSAYIDYPAVREDLKTQVAERVPRDCFSRDQCNGVGALASLIVNPLIDAVVTPAGLQAAFAARDLQRKESEPAPARTHGMMLPHVPDRPVVVHQGLDGFTVHERDRTRGALLFARRGLGWKLVGFELPEGAPAS